MVPPIEQLRDDLLTRAAILGENPNIPPERCVLQDRPDVIEHIKAMDEPALRKTEKQAIDFFVEQPVRGLLSLQARALEKTVLMKRQGHSSTLSGDACTTGQTIST